MENSQKRIEARQNGEVKMCDVGHFAKEHELEVGKMKNIIHEVLGIHGFVEFKTVDARNVIKLNKNDYLKDKPKSEEDNLPKWARYVGNEEIVTLYYIYGGYEDHRLKYQNKGWNFAEIEWI